MASSRHHHRSTPFTSACLWCSQQLAGDRGGPAGPLGAQIVGTNTSSVRITQIQSHPLPLPSRSLSEWQEGGRAAHHNPASSKERLFNPHIKHGRPCHGSPPGQHQAVPLWLEAAIHMLLTPAPSTRVAPDPGSHSLQTWNREKGGVQSLKVAGRSGPLAGDARSLGRKASSCFSSTASLGLAGIRICSLL